jgi:Flp pilus assembly protein TadB
MKPLLVKIRSAREPGVERPTADDNLGRGMEMALTLMLFLLVGWGIDQWLGIFPLFTVVLVVLAAVGIFVRLRYTYEAAMLRHEAERDARRAASTPAPSRREDAA